MNKLLIYIVLTALAIYLCSCRPLAPKKVLWAVSSGSIQSKRAQQGFLFDTDKNYDQNKNTVSVDYSTDSNYRDITIKYTYDQEVYQTERHGKESFKYYVPIEADGKYVLILKFNEMYFQKSGQRVFNINFGSHRAIDRLDIFKKAKGRGVAHDEYIEFQLKGNNIIIKDKVISDAYYDGKLQVEFEKLEGLDNPLVNGLILYQGMLSDTDFYELQMYRDKWEQEYRAQQRKKMQEQQKKTQPKDKKKEKIKIRNDHLDEMEEEYEEVETVKEKPQKEIPPLKDLLMTPLGVVAMIGFFVSTFVLVYFTFFDPYGIEKRKREQLKQQKEAGYKKVADAGPQNVKNE